MYAQLGATQFQGLYGPYEHDAEFAGKYAEVDIIGSKPDLQRTGSVLDTIVMSIRLMNTFCDVPTRLAELTGYVENGDVLPYVDGLGNLVGNFILEKVEVSTTETDINGIPTLCDAKVSLKEYVNPDRTLARSAAARRNAFALGAVSLNVNPVSPPPNAPTAINEHLSLLNSGTSQVGASLQNASADASAVSTFLNQAHNGVTAIKNDADALQQTVEGYGSEVENAETILANVSSLKDRADALSGSIAGGDLANSLNNFSGLTAAMDGVNIASLAVQKAFILR